MTEEHKNGKNIKNLIDAKPGYTSPLDYALSAVGNADTTPIHVPVLATEDMVHHACLAANVGPKQAKIIYEVMTQTAQEVLDKD